MHSSAVVQTHMHACECPIHAFAVTVLCTGRKYFHACLWCCHAAVASALTCAVTSSNRTNLCVFAMKGPSKSRHLQLQQPQRHNSSSSR
jgi:hypothetical protein